MRWYGGFIADLAQDGGDVTFGPEDLRYEAHDDAYQYLAAACSIRGILSVFAQPNRGEAGVAHSGQPNPVATG